MGSQLHLHPLAQTVRGPEPHHVTTPWDVRTNTAAALITQQTTAGSGFFIGDSTQPVPAKVVEWIWMWEFIEMVDLLPEQWAVKKEEREPYSCRTQEADHEHKIYIVAPALHHLRENNV